jgi:hypothetical protein
VANAQAAIGLALLLMLHCPSWLQLTYFAASASATNVAVPLRAAVGERTGALAAVDGVDGVDG